MIADASKAPLTPPPPPPKKSFMIMRITFVAIGSQYINIYTVQCSTDRSIEKNCYQYIFVYLWHFNFYDIHYILTQSCHLRKGVLRNLGEGHVLLYQYLIVSLLLLRKFACSLHYILLCVVVLSVFVVSCRFTSFGSGWQRGSRRKSLY